MFNNPKRFSNTRATARGNFSQGRQTRDRPEARRGSNSRVTKEIRATFGLNKNAFQSGEVSFQTSNNFNTLGNNTSDSFISNRSNFNGFNSNTDNFNRDRVPASYNFNLRDNTNSFSQNRSNFNSFGNDFNSRETFNEDRNSFTNQKYNIENSNPSREFISYNRGIDFSNNDSQLRRNFSLGNLNPTKSNFDDFIPQRREYHNSFNISRGNFTMNRGKFRGSSRGRGGFKRDQRGGFKADRRGGFKADQRGDFKADQRGGFKAKYNSSHKPVQQEQLKEVDVGITEYISDLEGFSGIIKARFSDFHVNEINCDGEVAKLTNNDVPEAFRDESRTEKIDYATLKCPLEQISEEKWKEIINLIDSKDPKIVSLDVTELNKDIRRDIHITMKKLFKQKIVASTVSKGDLKFIELKKYIKGDDQDKRINWPVDTPQYVHFVLYKEAMDTLEATYKVADALKMRPALFTYAGVKDRRAKTTQWFCVRKVDPKRLLNASKNIKAIHIGNITMKKEPLKLGQLKGNQFRIALRNVTGDDELIKNSMNSLEKNGFINYYGLQRFGNDKEVPTFDIGIQLMSGNWKEACNLILKPKASDDPRSDITNAKQVYQKTGNAHKARECLKKNRNKCVEAKLLAGLIKSHKNDYVNALEFIPRNMRLLYIHSFQSLVWNRMVSRRIKEFGMKPIVGDLVVIGDDGSLGEDGLLLLEGGEEMDTGAKLFSPSIIEEIDLDNVKPSNRKAKKNAPWMTDDLIKIIGRKDKLRTLIRKNLTNDRLKMEYKALRNRLTAEIRKAKTDFFGKPGKPGAADDFDPTSIKNSFNEIPEEKWEELISLFKNPNNTVEFDMSSHPKEKRDEVRAYIKENFQLRIKEVTELTENGEQAFLKFKLLYPKSFRNEERLLQSEEGFDPHSVENPFTEEVSEEKWKEIISVLDNAEKIVKLDMGHLTNEKQEEIHLYIKRKFKNKISSTTITECDAPKFMQFKKNCKLDDQKPSESKVVEEDEAMNTDDECHDNTEKAKDPDATNKNKNKDKNVIQRQEVKVLKEEDLENYTIFDIVLPLPGYDVVYPDNEVKTWYKEVLESYSLSLEMPKQKTRTYTLSGAYRKVVTKVDKLEWKIMKYSEPNSTLILSDYEQLLGEKLPEDLADGQYKALIADFCLPSSCYATMALREILKTDTSSSSHAKLNNYHEATSEIKELETDKSTGAISKEENAKDTQKRKAEESGEDVESKKAKTDAEDDLQLKEKEK